MPEFRPVYPFGKMLWTMRSPGDSIYPSAEYIPDGLHQWERPVVGLVALALAPDYATSVRVSAPRQAGNNGMTALSIDTIVAQLMPRVHDVHHEGPFYFHAEIDVSRGDTQNPVEADVTVYIEAPVSAEKVHLLWRAFLWDIDNQIESRRATAGATAVALRAHAQALQSVIDELTQAPQRIAPVLREGAGRQNPAAQREAIASNLEPAVQSLRDIHTRLVALQDLLK